MKTSVEGEGSSTGLKWSSIVFSLRKTRQHSGFFPDVHGQQASYQHRMTPMPMYKWINRRINIG